MVENDQVSLCFCVTRKVQRLSTYCILKIGIAQMFHCYEYMNEQFKMIDDCDRCGKGVLRQHELFGNYIFTSNLQLVDYISIQRTKQLVINSSLKTSWPV